jgi:probable addiction module antidote protein
MAKMPKEKSKTYPYDSAEYLTSGAAIHAYMEEALETDDAAFIAKALGTIARARGMSHIAKKAGLSRESLYKALSKEGNPEFDTVIRVMQALGLRFSITPHWRARNRCREVSSAKVRVTRLGRASISL